MLNAGKSGLSFRILRLSRAKKKAFALSGVSNVWMMGAMSKCGDDTRLYAVADLQSANSSPATFPISAGSKSPTTASSHGRTVEILMEAFDVLDREGFDLGDLLVQRPRVEHMTLGMAIECDAHGTDGNTRRLAPPILERDKRFLFELVELLLRERRFSKDLGGKPEGGRQVLTCGCDAYGRILALPKTPAWVLIRSDSSRILLTNSHDELFDELSK